MSFFQKKIIIRLQGGLGNQLYCYAAARALSLNTNKELLIDARPIKGEGPNRQYDLSVFDIKEKHVSGLTSWITGWVASVRLGKLFKVLFPLAWNFKIIRDKEEGFDASLSNPYRGTIILQGYWQSFKYFDNEDKILKKELTIKNEPDAINKNWIAELHEEESVALHVRRGDYVNNPTANAIHGTCTPEYYEKAIKLIFEKVENPSFYIFTDDPEWAENNISISAPTKVIKHNLGKSDYEDLRLMSHCKHFIIANSSFSWWGAWLSNNSSKIIIAPSKWFSIDSIPSDDRIPASWIRL
jgi:hypothetical protein